ncbi:MAG: tRNA (guanosine(37)-N1)-methyltransferase TrmD [Pseudomonadota bacterium]
MTDTQSEIFHAAILSLFPEMFPGILQHSLSGTALKKNIWSYDAINLRDFGLTKHKNVDDEPFGGGNGLVMRSDVLGDALDHAAKKNPNAKIYYLSPRGIPINQRLVEKIVSEKEIIILCGRFEGIDERVIEEYNATEISLGDFILSGGEGAALCLLDACIRLLPGVLQNQKTLSEESFGDIGGGFIGGLEYPLYTRPAEWRGRAVPEVLLSGNHKEIENWRSKQALRVTKERRPDLLEPKNK